MQQLRPHHSVRSLIVILLFGILACTTNTEQKETPTVGSKTFPDSTNLDNALDSLIFAEACLLDHNRNDIAERYFKAIISGRTDKEDCNTVVSDSYSWLSSIERNKTPIDTNLVLEYITSSHLACPKSGNSYFVHGNILLELGLDSAEHYINISIEKGEDIGIVSECINVNIDKIDTNKLNFDWLHLSELQNAYK